MSYGQGQKISTDTQPSVGSTEFDPQQRRGQDPSAQKSGQGSDLSSSMPSGGDQYGSGDPQWSQARGAGGDMPTGAAGTGMGGEPYGSGGQQTQPSISDKIRGEAEKIVGKMTGKHETAAKGQERQTGEMEGSGFSQGQQGQGQGQGQGRGYGY